jgi:hypothetical protein
MNEFVKYPRTPHILGSRLQAGDEDLEAVPFEALKGRFIVVEEKLDGANSGISFSEDAELLLQSRGHYLTGGFRERHFNLFKSWAHAREDELFDLLGSRLILYGEWLYAKHTEFYDQLPHYLMEFDLYDREKGIYLSTEERHKLLRGSSVLSVPVVWQGIARSLEHLVSLITHSLYKSGQWKEQLERAAGRYGISWEDVQRQTDLSGLSEGLYIKVEEEGEVRERYKYVRRDFFQKIQDSESHWQNRPILPNQLKAGSDIFLSLEEGGGFNNG